MKRESDADLRTAPFLLIGLDGASYDLVSKWASKGKIPNLKSLIDKGVFLRVESVFPSTSGPAWSTIVTGRAPSQHGVYDFVVRKPGKYRTRTINATDRVGKPIWTVLTEAERNVIVIGVPVTYPPVKVKGILVSCWLTPDGCCFTFPEKIQRELTELDYSPYLDGPPTFETYIRKTRSLTEVALYLMDNYPWDFFFVVYIASDRVQARYWYSPDKIERMFSVLDSQIGRLLQRIRDDARVALISDHGFEANHTRFSTNEWLLKKRG